MTNLFVFILFTTSLSANALTRKKVIWECQKNGLLVKMSGETEEQKKSECTAKNGKFVRRLMTEKLNVAPTNSGSTAPEPAAQQKPSSGGGW